MLIIGLTGSIATGKSTVSALLGAPPYSLPVIDADILARQVVEPGTAGYKAIVAHFGSTTPDLLVEASPPSMPEEGPSGLGRPLNRAALGRRVFGDEPERKADRAVLNSIVHPAVRRAMVAAAGRAYARGCWAVVLDVPLLFESRLDRFCGAVVVVAVTDPDTQLRRLRARDPHLSEAEARDRVRSQADVRVKARRCEARGGPARGAVLWNDGDKAQLEDQLRVVMKNLRAASPPWWGWALWLCPPLGVAAGLWTFWQNGRINRRWEEAELREKARL